MEGCFASLSPTQYVERGAGAGNQFARRVRKALAFRNHLTNSFLVFLGPAFFSFSLFVSFKPTEIDQLGKR